MNYVEDVDFIAGNIFTDETLWIIIMMVVTDNTDLWALFAVQGMPISPHLEFSQSGRWQRHLDGTFQTL